MIVYRPLFANVCRNIRASYLRYEKDYIHRHEIVAIRPQLYIPPKEKAKFAVKSIANAVLTELGTFSLV